MDKFEQRLKKAMRIRSKKQVDLVRNTGISKSMISEYTNGKFEPKQENLFLISKALNVKEAWLMGYDGVSMDRNTVDYESRFGDKAIGDEKMREISRVLTYISERTYEFDDLYYQVIAALDFINEDGFEKVIDYIQILSKNPNYSSDMRTDKTSDSNDDAELLLL